MTAYAVDFAVLGNTKISVHPKVHWVAFLWWGDPCGVGAGFCSFAGMSESVLHRTIAVSVDSSSPQGAQGLRMARGVRPARSSTSDAPMTAARESMACVHNKGCQISVNWGIGPIARSESDDPSTLAAQATPGWESAEARRAKAEAIQLSQLQQSWIASLRSQ